MRRGGMGEENLKLNENEDIAHEGQGEEGSRGVIERIGYKINDIVKTRNEQRKERRLMHNISEMDRLARSGNERDKKKLNTLRYAVGDVATTDDRALGAVLDSYDEFDVMRLSRLVDRGVEVEKIVNNKHTRELAVDYLEKLLKDDGDLDDKKGKLRISGCDWFMLGDVNASDKLLVEPVLEDVLRDEKVRKTIVENVGEDVIRRRGDEVCKKVVGVDYVSKSIMEDGDKAEGLKRRVGLLKQLGYEYLLGESNEEKEDKVSSLFGNNNGCRALDKLGLMNGEVVSAMYDMKAQRMVKYALDGYKDNSNRYSFWNMSDRERFATDNYIPEWLEPGQDDAMAQYWREQNKKCGFDAMAFVADATYKSLYKKTTFDDIIVAPSLDGSNIVEYLLNNNTTSFPAYDLKMMFYRPKPGQKDEYDVEMMTFFANNSEKIEDFNMRGFVANWAKIQCDTKEETEVARLAYLKYMAQGDDRFGMHWNAGTRRMEETAFFDKDGNPTEAFYDYDTILHYNPKKFLPFMDKNWQSHYSDKQLTGIDFEEAFPDFRYWIQLDCDSSDKFLDLLSREPDACAGLAAFTQGQQYDIGIITDHKITSENIGEFFDKNGPKQAFWQTALENRMFSFLADQLRAHPELNLGAGTQQFFELYDKLGHIPGFVYEKIEYVDENNRLRTRPWTENIPKYFGEDGPKPEFFQECLKHEPAVLFHMDEDLIAKAGLSEEALRVLEFGKKYTLPSFLIENKSYHDESGVVRKRFWTEDIPKYFDKDGPKPEFFQECLNSSMLSILSRLDEDMLSRAEFSEDVLRMLEFYKNHNGCLPYFLTTGVTYIDVAGNKKRKPWTENIPKYFDENGPKLEFFQECLKEREFRLLASMDEATLRESGIDDLTMQFLKARDMKESIEPPLDSSNIIAALTRFIKMDAVDWMNANESDLMVREAFSENKIKDMALEGLKKEYEGYLHGKGDVEPPVGLEILAEYMHQNDGAGPLVQIEAFLDFAGVLGSAGEKGRLLTSTIEDRMRKDHWDNQDKTNFYAVSAEVIQASPELYHEFAELFANIKDKKDFDTFTKDIYPLYRAKLALLREYDEQSDGLGNGFSVVNYDSVDKEALKNQLHNALLPFNLQELSPDKRQEGIDRVREVILGEITDLFHTRLGIRPDVIPENFSKSSIKSIEDMTLYLSNIAEPTPFNRNMIGLFLALQLDESDGWSKLRRGEEIDPDSYLSIDPYEGNEMQEAMRISRENNPVNQENTGIEDIERLHEFRAALQREISAMRIGSVQTIDQRLQSVISNIEDLTDPDLYPDEIDKKKLTILERYSPKSVGAVAAKMWQRANGKDIKLNDDEEAVEGDLAKLMEDQGADMTPENIKAYLQEGFNAIKIPFGIRQTVRDSRAVEVIGELQRLLMPEDDVARIFGKIGEEFRPRSGVLAVGADLDYLENLIVKHEDVLTEDEKTTVRGYIGEIRAKMGELEKTYDKIAQSFERFEKSMHGPKAERLGAEIAEVSKIVHGASSQTVVTTTCTTNMTTIIENMRACLSGKTKGINNDTDLTFGEGYKFYLYSSNGSTTEGSTSDEIIYFVPGEHDGERSMSFVMDRIYGHKNSDIFVSHVETVVKKAAELKNQFLEVPITVFIPESTMGSCSVGMSAEELATRVDLPLGATARDVTSGRFNVPESGFGDHYIEFGEGDARKFGERNVSGVEIVL